MLPTEEQALRGRTAALVLQWTEERVPPFAGERKEEFADAVVAAHVVADEARLGLHRWIDAARRAGLSWAEVGDALGVSKQAAQQRFRSVGDEDAATAEDGPFEVRRGATAFNELRMLRDAGGKGLELVRTGTLTLVFRRTERAWEYRRVVAVTAEQATEAMKADGWIYVSSWFPFHYFKRPVAAPAA